MSERYSDLADEADRIFSAIKDKRIALICEDAAKIDISNPSGECWYCGEETEARWCGAGCRDAWEKEQ